MSIPIVQVDAFTSTPFQGNPAAVCLLTQPMPDAWMQDLAAEMNLSETVFLHPRVDDPAPHAYDIRWFTPSVEVPLCGHATLASAHVLWEAGRVPADQRITFIARSGRLSADRETDWIRLDFPALPVEPADLPPGAADALGSRPRSAHRNRLGVFLVELPSAHEVAELAPDFARLRTIPHFECIVTAPAGDPEPGGARFDFVSRFFAPGAGIDEDPVTGSAHCSLGPFWAERLGRDELVGRQLSRRQGTVKVRTRGDRVDLLGQAVTIIRGELAAPVSAP